MVNIGVIGCGYWGPNLVRNFHGLPGCRVKRVSDLSPGRLEFVQTGYPDIETTNDYNDILNDPEITAVAVATPVTTHRSIGEQVLLAGKHLFVEKPLAHTAEDAWALTELAREKNLVLAVGHIFQYAPGVRRLRQEIESGALGQVFHISSTRINPGPPATTVDVVWDLCPHDLSIILHLTGEMPTTLTASGGSYLWEGHVDNAHITMGFPGGASAHIHVSWLSSNKTRLVQLFAENGSLVYDEMLALDGKVKYYDRGVDNRVAGASTAAQLGYSTGDIRILPLEQHEPLRLECSEFIRATQTGSSIPNDGVSGARVVELLAWISREIEKNAEAVSAPAERL